MCNVNKIKIIYVYILRLHIEAQAHQTLFLKNSQKNTILHFYLKVLPISSEIAQNKCIFCLKKTFIKGYRKKIRKFKNWKVIKKSNLFSDVVIKYNKKFKIKCFKRKYLKTSQKRCCRNISPILKKLKEEESKGKRKLHIYIYITFN